MKLLYLLLFVALLILHLLLCKKFFHNFWGTFQVYGLILFSLLIIVQLPIINYKELSVKAIGLYLLTYVIFLFSCVSLRKSHFIKLFNRLEFINYNYLNRIWKICTFIFGIFVIIQWIYVIKRFGSLSFIMNHSMAVRTESIDNQILPIYVSYSLGIGFVSTGIGSFLFFFQKKKIYEKLKYIIPVLLSVISGFADFSRMTMLMHIFVFASGFFIYMSGVNNKDISIKKEKKKYLRWAVFLSFLAIVVLILPKYFRDSKGQTIYNFLSLYSSIKTTNPIVIYLFNLFDYIAGPIVAFSDYIKSAHSDILCGAAFFRPLLHLLGRIFGFNYMDYELVYEFVQVPTTTNIYTWMREAFADWGYLGIAIVPLFWGMGTVMCLKVKFINTFLRYVLLQFIYLYILFGFFYTPYCQGSPTIGMTLYFLMTILFSKKINNNDCREKSET